LDALLDLHFFSALIRPLPGSTRVPYTTLFRSSGRRLLVRQYQRSCTAPFARQSFHVLFHSCQQSLCRFHKTPDTALSRACHRSQDRKSTRLNSSHVSISYAVFCLKKKLHETTT